MLILFLIIFLQDSWQSVTSIVKWYGDHQDEMIPVAGPGNWNDPDMVKKIKWFNYHSYTEKKKKKKEKNDFKEFLIPHSHIRGTVNPDISLIFWCMRSS